MTCGNRRGSQPPLVLVAGNGGRIPFWSGIAATLAPFMQLIAFDYRDAPTRTATGALFETAARKAEDLPGLLAALGLAHVNLLGHSTGAVAVAHFAARHPASLDKLVISGGWPGPHPYIEMSFGLRRKILQQIGADAFLIDGMFRAMPPEHLVKVLETSSIEDLLAFRGDADPMLDVERIDEIIRADTRSDLAAIRTPTLVVHAADDGVFPMTFGQAVASAITGSRFAALGTGAHLAPMVAPEAYAQTIMEYLAS